MYPALGGFIPPPDSPSNIRPVRYHEAASFVFLLRPAGSASTPDWVRGAVSGQVPPRCYHLNAPPAYIPPKAIGMAGSFHPASKRFRNLIHVSAVDRRVREPNSPALCWHCLCSVSQFCRCQTVQADTSFSGLQGEFTVYVGRDAHHELPTE